MIKSFGTAGGFMLGADCTIQGKGISHDKIRAAVEAAHACKGGASSKASVSISVCTAKG
ncbi:hypothetical protein AGMMS49928_16670 [Spirochaetia bacterium]|nr:hypothetical protein AGMMS49928_16670 [Spirochaetia bacterium]